MEAMTLPNVPSTPVREGSSPTVVLRPLEWTGLPPLPVSTGKLFSQTPLHLYKLSKAPTFLLGIALNLWMNLFIIAPFAQSLVIIVNFCTRKSQQNSLVKSVFRTCRHLVVGLHRRTYRNHTAVVDIIEPKMVANIFGRIVNFSLVNLTLAQIFWLMKIKLSRPQEEENFASFWQRREVERFSASNFRELLSISRDTLTAELLMFRHRLFGILPFSCLRTKFWQLLSYSELKGKRHICFCFLLLLCLPSVSCNDNSTNATSEANGNRTMLHDGPLEFNDILPENPREYDKMAPPRDVGHPTIVYFHVTVMSLDSIDESSMTYAADIFFAQSWKDWRLRLPDNMTHEYRLLPVHWLQDIWRPDSFFKNAKAVTFQERTIPNHYIWLYQDKTILYMVKLTLVLSCAMNFQVYPHDTQECSMKIESLSHTTDDLVFVWDPEVPLVVDRIELPQLDLVKNVTGDCTQVYSTGNFTCLEVIFTFKRRLGYYLFHTYIPTCLIVIMSWISFWIRPEAVPARVTLGVTSLLTLTTQHANSQKSLPPVSYIKAIDVFMSSCMVFVFCSLMEYALVNVVVGDVTDEMIKHKKGHYAQNMMSFREAIKARSNDCLGKNTRSTEEGDESPSRSRKSSPSRKSPAKGSANGRKKIIKSLSEVDSRSGSGGDKTFPPSSSSCFEMPSTTASGLRSTTPLTVNIGLPPPPPPPVSHDKQITQLMKRRREKAILIDRFSRVMFPLSFTVLNVIYWSVFVIEWNFLFS